MRSWDIVDVAKLKYSKLENTFLSEIPRGYILEIMMEEWGRERGGEDNPLQCFNV